MPYDPVKSFQPLSQLATGGPALIARRAAPFDDLRGFIAHARTKSSGITYGTWGTGSSAHLFGEMLARQTGVSLVHVPYRGRRRRTSTCSAARSMWLGQSGHGAQSLKTGKIKVLGLTGSKRFEVMPGVALFTGQGLKGFDLDSWVGTYAPANTPRPVVNEIVSALREATRHPDIRTRWLDMGFEPLGNTPEEFAASHKADFPKWVEIINAAGVKPE